MTERLTEVEARRVSVQELEAVTDVMRSLAAMRLQQALGTLAGTSTYAEVIAGALAQAAALLDDAPLQWPANGQGPSALVLFAPEHGFVGAFAEKLADAALAAPDDCALWVVGLRGAALLEERGRPPDWSTAMATNTDAVTATARRIADTLYHAAAEGRLGRVELLYGRTNAGAPPELVHRPLLPLGLPRNGARPAPPLNNMPPRDQIARQIAGVESRQRAAGGRICLRPAGRRGNGKLRRRECRALDHHDDRSPQHRSHAGRVDRHGAPPAPGTGHE